jgi:hypothetical protein
MNRNFHEPEILSFSEWVSVLKLSHLWEFKEIRKQAIAKLTPTEHDDPITRIELARTYQVREWFMPALKLLAVQSKPLSEEDVPRLGLAFSLKVSQLQGNLQGYKTSSGTPTSRQMEMFIRGLFPAATTSDLRDRQWDPESLELLPLHLDYLPIDVFDIPPNPPTLTSVSQVRKRRRVEGC